MKTYKYKNYTEYIKAQKAAYAKKINNVWAVEENIKAISEILKPLNPKSGLCHGVRQGWEVIWFRKYLDCFVMGTDIGKPLQEFICQMDFNTDQKSWHGRFDFIYSNSFDHAYNPPETFVYWIWQVRPGGVIVLEYDRRQEHTGEISKGVNKVDPVSIKLDELTKLVKRWSRRVKKVKVVDMPVVTQEWRKAVFIEV